MADLPSGAGANSGAARPEVTRLDEALRRHAPEKYRRDASLAGLVDF